MNSYFLYTKKKTGAKNSFFTLKKYGSPKAADYQKNDAYLLRHFPFL